MYPSSQPQRPSAMASSQGSLTRYCSAPGSLLTSAVNSVIGGGSGEQEFDALGSESMMGRFFNADLSSPASESSCKTNVPPDLNKAYRGQGSARVGGAASSSAGLQRSYGFNDIAVGDFGTSSFAGGGGGGNPASAVGGGVPSSLARHSSSPAGFFNHLLVDNNGFSITRGTGNYSSQTNGGLKSQLNFTSGKESLSQISEESGIGGCSSGSSTFPVGSWDETNSIFFSNPSNKRAKIVDRDILTGLDGLDTQFNLSRSSLEMASVEKYLHMNQDHVQCRSRAKRGCATHPRSIAERERRTRISEKLKKLQELVPNMDKQTNTADMLDLAVQHIKSLQSHVQVWRQLSFFCGCEINENMQLLCSLKFPHRQDQCFTLTFFLTRGKPKFILGGKEACKYAIPYIDPMTSFHMIKNFLDKTFHMITTIGVRILISTSEQCNYCAVNSLSRDLDRPFLKSVKTHLSEMDG